MNTPKNTKGMLAVAAFSILLAGCQVNGSPTPMETLNLSGAEPFVKRTAKDKESEEDEKFLIEAAEMSMQEIMLGELAIQKASMTSVREMGEMIAEDHNAMLDDLKQLSRSKSMSLPAAQPDKAIDAHHKLNTKSSEDFDKCYVQMMIKCHEDAITKFEDAAENCSDAEIRKWADSQLPDLRKHLEHAKFCEKKMKEM